LEEAAHLQVYDKVKLGYFVSDAAFDGTDVSAKDRESAMRNFKHVQSLRNLATVIHSMLLNTPGMVEKTGIGVDYMELVKALDDRSKGIRNENGNKLLNDHAGLTWLAEMVRSQDKDQALEKVAVVEFLHQILKNTELQDALNSITDRDIKMHLKDSNKHAAELIKVRGSKSWFQSIIDWLLDLFGFNLTKEEEAQETEFLQFALGDPLGIKIQQRSALRSALTSLHWLQYDTLSEEEVASSFGSERMYNERKDLSVFENLPNYQSAIKIVKEFPESFDSFEGNEASLKALQQLKIGRAHV
jgi:hypothetical protein